MKSVALFVYVTACSWYCACGKVSRKSNCKQRITNSYSSHTKMAVNLPVILTALASSSLSCPLLSSTSTCNTME